MSASRKTTVRRTAVPENASTPLVTPLITSVAYDAADADALDGQYDGRVPGFTYAREGHPNAEVLAAKIDALEGASGGVVTSSGMSAITAVFLGVLKAGDHVLGGDQLYGRTLKLLNQDLPRFGISASLADPTDINAMAAAIRPETKMILIEVVSNPTIRVADIEGIAKLARKSGALLVIDNTFTTPRGFQPFMQGADIIVHSVTKLLAGHSDATLGYAVARDPALNAAIRDVSVTMGFTASPFDCWLAERGMHSFDLRYDRAEANAAALADHIAGLPGVETVLYPLRPDHPDHNRARAVLGDRGGNMLSFCLSGGRQEANALIRAAENIPFAATLGDVATTMSHAASSSHRGMSEEARRALGITEGFFRMSVGIEDIEVLRDDLSAAFDRAGF